MGKTSKPLTILLLDAQLAPYFTSLGEKGHTIDVYDGGCQLEKYDRIYGSRCYRLTTEMLDNLPANTLPELVKAARAEKYNDHKAG